MKIKSIILNNYRIYKGENRIDFEQNEDKNLFLVFGENGFGKTTFLHSLLWCLYGRLMFDIDDSFKKELISSTNKGGYNSLLKNNLNNGCKRAIESIDPQAVQQIKRSGYTPITDVLKKNTQYSVTLEFSEVFIPSIPCKSVKIIRSYDFIREEESTRILIDGTPNELTTEIGNDVFINDFILNKDIARFFFFDSERIVTLAESNTVDEKRNLCSAYNEVLGVKKYEDLKKNLENTRLRLRKKTADIESRNKLNAFIKKREELQTQLDRLDKETIQIEEALIELKKENESLQIQLLREGNNTTIEELNRQKALLDKTKELDVQYKQDLKTFLDYAPFAIAGKLFKAAKERIEHDFHTLQTINNTQERNAIVASISSEINDIIKISSISETDKYNLLESLSKVIARYQENSSDKQTLLEVSKECYKEFMSVYNNVTGTYRSEFEHLADDYKKNKQRLNAAARKISNMQSNEDDDIIAAIRKKKNTIEDNIKDLESKIKDSSEAKGSTLKELSVVNRQLSELSKKVSVDDSDSQKDSLAEQLITELNTFLITLKAEKKSSLERRIKATLNNLMHKSDFIGNVCVDIVDDMIDIELLSCDGSIIRKESLSKGEQQLYATSLLKALVEESGIEFPVFIDSPLQKFDKSHAGKIITEFYPSISKQVVLFPLLHKELTQAEFSIMKPYISKLYRLSNSNTSSCIEPLNVESIESL